MIDITVNSTELNARLKTFEKSIRKRQKLANYIAKEVRKLAAKNIRRQKEIEGDPFEKRKNQRIKRKLLLGLGKAGNLKAYSKASSGGGAAVGYPKGGLMGMIAYRHQHGLGENWNPERAAREQGTPDYKAKATPKQAKALIRAGYRLRVPAKGGKRKLKRVSSHWIQEHLGLGQAGIILRILRTGEAQGVQEWKDTVPSRPFLGVNDGNVKELLEGVANKFLNGGKKGAKL